tara:strand:- start:23 stop:517 length:495 start_codon:yes stop_codon:yes gene_type:complete
MKQLLITIAALVLVGCGESQQSATAPEPQTAKAPEISIHVAVINGDIEAVKQHLAAGTDVNANSGITRATPLHFSRTKEIAELLISKGADVNAKNADGWTPLFVAAMLGPDYKNKIVELLIAAGADVNAKTNLEGTPLDQADGETADLLRKNGGKTVEELKAEG